MQVSTSKISPVKLDDARSLSDIVTAVGGINPNFEDKKQ
jgi:hypothetical protein